MTQMFKKLLNRIESYLDNLVDGVADEFHAIEMKKSDHLLWHPDCPGMASKTKAKSSAQAGN